MAFIFIFIDLPPYSLTFLQNGPVITRKNSCWFSLWLCLWFPLGARPGCIVVVWHVEGRRGETARNDSNPIPSHALPGASHIHSGKEEASLYSSQSCQGRAPGYSVTFRGGQRAFPLSQTKKVTDPGFSLREEEKAQGEQKRSQKDPKSQRKALGLARGSF